MNYELRSVKIKALKSSGISFEYVEIQENGTREIVRFIAKDTITLGLVDTCKKLQIDNFDLRIQNATLRAEIAELKIDLGFWDKLANWLFGKKSD